MILTNDRFSIDREIKQAYIITIENNDTSIKLANRCMISCANANQSSCFWPAFDGTGKGIKIPDVFVNADWLNWIKIPSNLYSNSQIACFFSHFSLWAHCAKIDSPIIILEHDAICEERLEIHGFYNCIQYLGCKEQKESGIIMTIPPHATMFDSRWRSLCRAHAYAIDPPVARNLISYAIREGMTKTLDMFIRADIFSIVQNGLYFYDEPGISTISEPKNCNGDYV